MTEAALQDLLRSALWLSVTISAPILLAALMTGLLIGLFQALTSIQEMTLTFVPKVGAMLVVLWLSMGFMTTSLKDFFLMRIIPAIAGG